MFDVYTAKDLKLVSLRLPWSPIQKQKNMHSVPAESIESSWSNGSEQKKSHIASLGRKLDQSAPRPECTSDGCSGASGPDLLL